MVTPFQAAGWVRVPFDPAVKSWVDHVHPAAEAAMYDPALAHWWVCEDTWFVGVDALDNDATGAVGTGPALGGAPIDDVRHLCGHMLPLHKAQVSVTRPGYPRPRSGETEAAFRYRQIRAAAHVDGIRADGPDRRRRIAEPHAFILGLPLNQSHPQAAPLVVWEGSHHIIGAALRTALAGHAPATWGQVDITDAYVAARKEVFARCDRVQVQAEPGEATLLHRHVLHGVDPWPDGVPGAYRMIAYFRPELPGGVAGWLAPD
ncbi:hypothetical protein [Shimia sp. SDUM112013]|uniref:hypothetical protein n=1 Tax=Shimia sp. SDUM112013 TaxID=3136160 RepID=UPI0032EB5AF6